MTNKDNSRIVLIGPHLNAPSGVSAFVRAIHSPLVKQLRMDVEIVEVGSEGSRGHPVLDQLRFARIVRQDGTRAVMLNPSIMWKAILRDGLFAIRSKRCGVPVVSFVHGWDERLWAWQWVRLWCKQTIFSVSEVVWVLSEQLVSEVSRLGVGARVRRGWTVVGGDLLSLRNGRRRPSIQSGIQLLYLGRLVEGKGLWELIDAMSLLTRQTWSSMACEGELSWCLRIAGNGPLEKSLRRKVHAKGLSEVVEFVGMVRGEQKRELLQDSHALILPSHSEGLPVSILEAMTYGVVPVVTGVGAIPAHVFNGINGVILENTQPTVIARALRDLFVSQEAFERISRNAVTASSRYRPEPLAEELAREIRGVIGEKTD